MMTVKHITLSGEEFVFATTHVNFIPGSAKHHVTTKASLWWYDESGSHELDDGSVYVMNEHGKTVARYMLSSNEPSAA